MKAGKTGSLVKEAARNDLVDVNSKLRTMPVSLQWHGRVATVTANQNGDFEWSGDPGVATRAIKAMHENGWTRGGFLNDELFLVRRVVKTLGDCEIVDVGNIVKTLREGWVQLLRDHLLPDPGAHLGKHLYSLTTGKRLACKIETRSAKLSLRYGHGRTRFWSISGTVHVGDPAVLRFASRMGNRTSNVSFPIRQIAWERIESIHFSYFSPKLTEA